jgi:hypothetical protein
LNWLVAGTGKRLPVRIGNSAQSYTSKAEHRPDRKELKWLLHNLKLSCLAFIPLAEADGYVAKTNQTAHLDLKFLIFQWFATLEITDSGGIQEETYFLLPRCSPFDGAGDYRAQGGGGSPTWLRYAGGRIPVARKAPRNRVRPE